MKKLWNYIVKYPLVSLAVFFFLPAWPLYSFISIPLDWPWVENGYGICFGIGILFFLLGLKYERGA